MYHTLGRWKHIIVCDLANAFYQNHIDPASQQWLGIMTPFAGLRVLTRSGQGLLGQTEELHELLAKVLKEELAAGTVTKLHDDLIIGGDTHEETIHNYLKVLHKLWLANLRIDPAKTIIFPKSADIGGWVWKQGGLLEVSPHRKNSLTNTKTEHISTIKHMRSFLGLYKTLHITTPAMSRILAPLKESVAGKESKDPYIWTHSLTQRFKEAQSHINNAHTLSSSSKRSASHQTRCSSQFTRHWTHIICCQG